MCVYISLYLQTYDLSTYIYIYICDLATLHSMLAGAPLAPPSSLAVSRRLCRRSVTLAPIAPEPIVHHANWRVSTPSPSLPRRFPLPLRISFASPRHQVLPPANWRPSPSIHRAASPRPTQGPRRHRRRPPSRSQWAGPCLRGVFTGTPVGPRGPSHRGHPAKGPDRQSPRAPGMSQQRTASA